MKSYSVVLVIVLSLVSLSFVAWIGRPKKANVLPEPFVVPKVEDLPMPKSGPYGKAEVAESEFNFGTRNVGEKGTHVFSIKNVGEGVLEFKLGKPSCQCTLGEVTRENGEEIKEGPVAPGETINIHVKWDMKFKNDKFRQYVPVFTTDPDQRKIEFAIFGEITNVYEIKPEGVWNVGDITGNEPAHAEGYFVSKALDEFTLVEVPREEPREASKVKVVIEPIESQTIQLHELKSGFRIEVEVSPEIPVGRFRESFRLKAISNTGGERIVDFTVIANRPAPIDVRGVVGAGYNAESDRLLFRDFLASSGSKATMTLFVKGFEGDLEIQSVEPETSRVKVKLLDSGKILGKTKAYKASIEIQPGAPINHRGIEAELINLKLNHPDVPDFKLLIDYNATR